jgi:hypothetical protein
MTAGRLSNVRKLAHEPSMVVDTSPFHSLTLKMANRRRKLVLTAACVNYRQTASDEEGLFPAIATSHTPLWLAKLNVAASEAYC